MLSIYRMGQYLRVSDLPTKNNTRGTSHWSGLGSSGVANNYRLLLVETSDEREGITENHRRCLSFSVIECRGLSPLPPIQVRTTETIE